jgi:hypothetical protein
MSAPVKGRLPPDELVDAVVLAPEPDEPDDDPVDDPEPFEPEPVDPDPDPVTGFVPPVPPPPPPVETEQPT